MAGRQKKKVKKRKKFVPTEWRVKGRELTGRFIVSTFHGQLEVLPEIRVTESRRVRRTSHYWSDIQERKVITHGTSLQTMLHRLRVPEKQLHALFNFETGLTVVERLSERYWYYEEREKLKQREKQRRRNAKLRAMWLEKRHLKSVSKRAKEGKYARRIEL